MATFWDVPLCNPVDNDCLMMEAVMSSETSVNVYQTTWRNIPEDSRFRTRYHQNLKSHCFTN
jgi:hypothetical protein